MVDKGEEGTLHLSKKRRKESYNGEWSMKKKHLLTFVHGTRRNVIYFLQRRRNITFDGRKKRSFHSRTLLTFLRAPKIYTTNRTQPVTFPLTAEPELTTVCHWKCVLKTDIDIILHYSHLVPKHEGQLVNV